MPSAVRIADHSKGALSAQTVQSLETHLTDHPEIVKIFTLPNIKNADSVGILPNGTVTLIDEGAALDPSMFPSKFFSVLTVYQVTASDNVVLTDEKFIKSGLDDSLRAFLGEGPSLNNTYINHCDPNLVGQDKQDWKPSLGKTGWVSISKYEPRRFESTYYICVFSSNDTMSTELANIAEDMSLQTDIHSIEGDSSPLTVDDFMQRDEYKYAKIVARRNNDYIAKFVADTLDLQVGRTKPDTDGLINIETRRYNTIAVPSTVTYFGHISRVTYRDGQVSRAAIAVYDKCGSVALSVNGCAVPLGPMEGVALFEGIRQTGNITTNETFTCVPCGIGHNNGHAALDTSQARYVQTCVHWEGKEDNRLHSKTTRDYRKTENVIKLIQQEGASFKQLQHVFTTLPSE